MSRSVRLTLLALLALVVVVGVSALMMTGPSAPRALFEAADQELDTMDGSLEAKEAPTSPPAPRQEVPQARMRIGLKRNTGASASMDVGEPSASGAAMRKGLGSLEEAGEALSAIPRSGYLSSEYLGGGGQLDRMAELVDEGIVLDGATVKLGALTASYQQPVAVPPGEALAVFANLEHAKIPVTGGTTHLQVGIQAADRELPQRPPVQILLVLDTSGSMETGRKLFFARRAALDLVDKLAPTDEIGLVIYSDAPELVIPLGARGDGTAARAAIDAVQPGGGTNISGALEAAYAHLTPKRNKDAVARVVLLSDGKPTQGVTDPAYIRRLAFDAFQEGLQTTTLGVGLDFNSDLMLGIAQDGKGNYHFVRDGDAIARVLTEELDQLTHVVAQAVRLRIELPAHTRIVRILGAELLDASSAAAVRTEERNLDRRIADELGISENRQTDEDEGLKLVVPAFHMGRSHVVMIEVELPPGQEPIEVASVEVKFKDLVARTNRERHVTVTAQRSPDRAGAVSSLNRAVKKNLLGFQTGEALLRAGQHVDRGMTQLAVQEIDDQMALLGVAAAQWRDADLERDVVLLGAYKDVLLANAGGGLGHEARRYLSRALTYNGYKLTR